MFLPGQPCQGQVAAAEVSDDGVDGIGTEQQVEFGVQKMPQKQLDDNLFFSQALRQFVQARFVFVVRSAEGQLAAKLFRQALLHPDGGLVVDRRVLAQQAQSFTKLLLRRLLHPHQQPARSTAIGPVLDMIVEFLPPAQVEIADTKIGTVGDFERLHQRTQQLRFDVVEDTRHGVVSSAEPMDAGRCKV